MKLTKVQAEQIFSDFQHFDGSKIQIKYGGVGQRPVVIMLPYDSKQNKACSDDILARMQNGIQLKRQYLNSVDDLYSVEIFFYDGIPNSLFTRHSEIDIWLKSMDIEFDYTKYGLIKSDLL